MLSWDSACLDGFQLVLESHRVPNWVQSFCVIMINDLKIVSPRFSNWKYVDDVTVSEIVPTGEVSILQNELDAIGDWTSTNNMKLNPQKCKEMIISFRRDISGLYPT